MVGIDSKSKVNLSKEVTNSTKSSLTVLNKTFACVSHHMLLLNPSLMVSYTLAYWHHVFCLRSHPKIATFQQVMKCTKHTLEVRRESMENVDHVLG